MSLGKLTTQFKQIEGELIVVDGRRLKIHQFGLFDLAALNAILGKQNHSSTFFDAWTDVRLSHIRKHDGDTHTPDVCKDIKFLVRSCKLEDLDKFYTHHSNEGLATRRKGVHFWSVIANNHDPLSPNSYCKDMLSYQ